MTLCLNFRGSLCIFSSLSHTLQWKGPPSNQCQALRIQLKTLKLTPNFTLKRMFLSDVTLPLLTAQCEVLRVSHPGIDCATPSQLSLHEQSLFSPTVLLGWVSLSPLRLPPCESPRGALYPLSLNYENLLIAVDRTLVRGGGGGFPCIPP